MGTDRNGKIGFTCGTWDLCHAGHVAHFEECKTYCQYLIVGLQIDPSLDRPNKNKPILSLDERYNVLRGIRWIDAIIVYRREEELMALEYWLPVDFRFRGIDHVGEDHYGSKGKLIDIVGDNSIHTSDIRKRICAH